MDTQTRATRPVRKAEGTRPLTPPSTPPKSGKNKQADGPGTYYTE